MDPIVLLLEALIAGMSQITGVNTCVEFPKRRDAISLPAILLNLVELEPDTDPGTDELALISHWEARLVMSDRGSETVLCALLQNILLWLTNENFPEIHVGQAQLKQAAPDHFTPDFQGHRVWLIEWTQKIRIGENGWLTPGELDGFPETIFVGWPNGEQEEQDVSASDAI